MQKYIKSKCTALKYATLVCIASLCVESLAMRSPYKSISKLRQEDARDSALSDPNSKPVPLGSDVSSSILFKRWQRQSSRRYTVSEKANPGDRHGENKLEASQLSIIPEECEKWELTAENLAESNSQNVPAKESEDSTKSINSFFSDKSPQKWRENTGPLTREHIKKLHDDCKAEFKEVYTRVNNMPNGSKTICETLINALSTLENRIYIIDNRSRAPEFVKSFVTNYKTMLIYLALAKLYDNSHHTYENLQKPLSELMKVFNATDPEKLFDEMFSSNVDHEAKWSELLGKGIVHGGMVPVSRLIQELRKRSHAGKTVMPDQIKNMLTPIQFMLYSFGPTPIFETRQIVHILHKLGYGIGALIDPGAELQLKASANLKLKPSANPDLNALD